MDPLFELALLVKAAQRELERVVNEAMRPLGLTGPQSDALVVIGQAEPVALKDLGGLLIAEAGHPSRLVDRLVEAGWVERRASAGDRRRLELSLTADGRRLVARVEEVRAEVFALARSLLGDRDVEPVAELLRAMLSGFELGAVIERRRALAAGAAPTSPHKTA